jgi:hypothetical protein
MNTEQQLLTEATNEIKNLRKENELMKARLSMFDSIMMMLHTNPAYPGQGMSPDLVYTI